MRDLTERLSRAKAVVFARFNGLGVADNEDLRRQLREANSEYYVTKKTLLKKALSEQGAIDFDPKSADGQMAAIFGYGDEVTPAKVTSQFIKSTEGKLEFAGGILEGRLLSKQEVMALSQIPGREELYAKLVGSINAPVSGFVNALAGNLRNLVNVLHAVQEKK